MTRLLTLILGCLLSLPASSWAVGVLTPNAGDATYMVSERAAESVASTMVNGNTVFTIGGGPIQILELLSVCVTANDVTASTMQWQSAPTVGTATTFSGASASLASATAGTTVLLTPTALSTAPTIVAASAGGVQLGLVAQNHIIVKDGTIKLVIGTGSTTGTWKHLLRYKPLSPSSTVN